MLVKQPLLIDEILLLLAKSQAFSVKPQFCLVQSPFSSIEPPFLRLNPPFLWLQNCHHRASLSGIGRAALPRLHHVAAELAAGAAPEAVGDAEQQAQAGNIMGISLGYKKENIPLLVGMSFF